MRELGPAPHVVKDAVQLNAFAQDIARVGLHQCREQGAVAFASSTRTITCARAHTRRTGLSTLLPGWGLYRRHLRAPSHVHARTQEALGFHHCCLGGASTGGICASHPGGSSEGHQLLVHSVQGSAPMQAMQASLEGREPFHEGCEPFHEG